MSAPYRSKGQLRRNAIRQGKTRAYEQAREVEAVFHDMAVYGTGFLRAGKRIDPLIVAADMVPAKASSILHQGKPRNA